MRENTLSEIRPLDTRLAMWEWAKLGTSFQVRRKIVHLDNCREFGINLTKPNKQFNTKMLFIFLFFWTENIAQNYSIVSNEMISWFR